MRLWLNTKPQLSGIYLVTSAPVMGPHLRGHFSLGRRGHDRPSKHLSIPLHELRETTEAPLTAS